MTPIGCDVMWLDDTKTSSFVRDVALVCRKNGGVPAVQHGGSSIML